jgi:phage gpG-like protein
MATPNIPRKPANTPGMISSGMIKLNIGNHLRIDGDIRGTIEMGWALTPSIGLVAKDIDRMGLAIQSFREPIVKSIKEVVIPSIRKNFREEGRPDAWEPLAEYTVKVRGNTGPILTRTGQLKRGATQFNIWSISDTSATVKKLPDSVWYGAIHQAGTGGFAQYMTQAQKELGKRASGRDIIQRAYELLDSARGGASGHRKVYIPQRQFIMYQEDDIDDIQQIFYDWLVAISIREGKFSRR